jgi:hypothetical protein
MPLSNSEREMLLSAALDSELSVREQAEFDRALQDEPEFAREFEELKNIRADLRRGLAAMRSQKMPAGAVDRIVAAAMDQSVGPASHSITPAKPTSPTDSRKWLLPAVVGLAAAMLIALSLWGRGDVSRPVALLDSSFKSSVPEDQPEPSKTPASSKEPDALPEPIMVPETRDVPEASDQDLPRNRSTVAPPKVMGLSKADISDTNEQSMDKPARQPLSLVLVLSVELTEKGHERLSLQEALRTTNIRLSGDSLMKSDVVTHLRDAKVIDTQANSAESTAKLYFIEASAKRIDEFLTYLMTDKESFASVGLSLASEPPLLAAVGDLREIDPTQVQQTGMARHLASSDGRPLSVDSSFPFIPLSQDIVESGLTQSAVAPQPSANTVDDFPSQLLLLVK